jgi:hypothetical protein
MAAIKDLKGQRFTRLLVICQIRIFKRKNVRWRCLCDCGKYKTVQSGHLRAGDIKSCGCFRKDSRHGHTANGKISTTYVSWYAMIRRCTKPNHDYYYLYGGRGITVCERWRKSFRAFLEDMGDKPEGMSIDRWPNPAGNYEPGNCRWATRIEQARNKRK